MTILSYPVHISANGEVTPIPNWTGGAIKAKIYVELSETEEEQKAAGQKFFDTWNGLLEGMPDMTAKEIRAERLERKTAENARVTERSPEERREAIDKFMKAWKGCLKGVPHQTAKEIRAERLEKKYGDKK